MQQVGLEDLEPFRMGAAGHAIALSVNAPWVWEWLVPCRLLEFSRRKWKCAKIYPIISIHKSSTFIISMGNLLVVTAYRDLVNFDEPIN